MQNSPKYSAGFTLIEMVVVISLVVMLMLAATALFYTTLLGNTKASVLQSIRSEGSYALAQMEFLIRNAVQILPNSNGQTCSSGMSELVLRSYDNGITALFAEEDTEDGNLLKIASNSGTYLTSGTVELIAGPTFNCTQNADQSTTFVEINFTLRRGTPGIDQTRDIVQQNFTSKVNIRSR